VFAAATNVAACAEKFVSGEKVDGSESTTGLGEAAKGARGLRSEIGNGTKASARPLDPAVESCHGPPSDARARE